MVAYSFKTLFSDPIRSGRKTQTIRADRAGRSRHARIGDQLQLYTGMRTRQCRLIGRAVCRDIMPLRIDFMADQIIAGGLIVAAGTDDLEEFAQLDGFKSWPGMRDFWEDEHGSLATFRGVIIYWKDFAAAA